MERLRPCGELEQSSRHFRCDACEESGDPRRATGVHEMMEHAKTQDEVICPRLQLSENHLDVHLSKRHVEIRMLGRKSARQGNVGGQVVDACDLMAGHREAEADVALCRADVEDAQRAIEMGTECSDRRENRL